VNLRHAHAGDPGGEPQAGNAGDLVERGAALGFRIAGKAAGKFRKDRSLGMAPDAYDEGESEPRAVFRIPPGEPGSLLRGQFVEPRARLLVT
jgi:hypothetical protein